MTVCPKCKFYNICKGRLNETVENCVRFKSAEQTNDEWRKTCSAEEFSEFLCNVGFENETIVRKFKSEWVKWLKQPHEQKGD